MRNELSIYSFLRCKALYIELHSHKIWGISTLWLRRLHLSSVVPCIWQIIHESRVFTAVVDSSRILSRQCTFILTYSHIVYSVLEGGCLRDAVELVDESHVFGLFFEDFQFG